MSDQLLRDWRDLWQPILATARERDSARRARVLADPELAKQLLAEPIAYQRPDQWTGYVPPRLIPGPGDDDWRLNHSPRRDALVQVAATAKQREAEAN